MRIENTSRNTVLADAAWTASTYWSRLVGLLGRRSLEPGEGLLIDPCTSVHTAFMRFTIDVVYVDRDRRVVKLSPKLRPFRVSAMLRGGHSVIELPSGTIAATATEVGDQLSFDGATP